MDVETDEEMVVKRKILSVEGLISDVWREGAAKIVKVYCFKEYELLSCFEVEVIVTIKDMKMKEKAEKQKLLDRFSSNFPGCFFSIFKEKSGNRDRNQRF